MALPLPAAPKLAVKVTQSEGGKAYSYEVMEIKNTAGTLGAHMPKG